ncbi:hypothetical protein GCM10010282_40490 [Streptomyces roseolus]|nr:hypothetical protein GCM10010282_40490 [Streptomyces roseolus]
MVSRGLSRYAADASAFVAPVRPLPPWSGICAPGPKPSIATSAPITAITCAGRSRLPRPAQPPSWAPQRNRAAWYASPAVDNPGRNLWTSLTGTRPPGTVPGGRGR